MELQHFKDFLYMGGYAAYVWPAYGLVIFVIILSIVKTLKHKHKVLRELRSRHEAAP